MKKKYLSKNKQSKKNLKKKQSKKNVKRKESKKILRRKKSKKNFKKIQKGEAYTAGTSNLEPFEKRKEIREPLDYIEMGELDAMTDDEKVKGSYGHKTTNCYICNKEFGLGIKNWLIPSGRHHCRNCYISVCDVHFIPRDLLGERTPSQPLCSVCCYYNLQNKGKLDLHSKKAWDEIYSEMKDENRI